MLRLRSKLGSAGIGAITLMSLMSLTGCIGDAGSGAPTATTLAPLIQTSYATISPATSTTLNPPIGGTGDTVVSAAVTSLPSTPGSTVVPSTSAADETYTGATYTVVARDTVFGIARRAGISAQALADFNDWPDGIDHPIYPGDSIKVPAEVSPPAPTSTSAPGGSAASTTSTSVTAGPGGTYVIVAGDYLAAIAAKTGTTVQAIVEVNGWPDGDKHLIVPGQTIKLPAKTG